MWQAHFALSISTIVLSTGVCKHMVRTNCSISQRLSALTGKSDENIKCPRIPEKGVLAASPFKQAQLCKENGCKDEVNTAMSYPVMPY